MIAMEKQGGEGRVCCQVVRGQADVLHRLSLSLQTAILSFSSQYT